MSAKNVPHIKNKFNDYEIAELMESAQNCVDMLIQAENGTYHFQTTNFDKACFADIMIPLNMELINRGIEPIKMGSDVYKAIETLKNEDRTYIHSLDEFKEYVGKVDSLKGNEPKWFKPIKLEESIPYKTSANVIFGSLLAKTKKEK